VHRSVNFWQASAGKYAVCCGNTSENSDQIKGETADFWNSESHENPWNSGNPMKTPGIQGIPWESQKYDENFRSK
jgi:hypothetical protein